MAEHLLPNIVRVLSVALFSFQGVSLRGATFAVLVGLILMGLLRFILTALLAIFALIAGFFAMLLVAITGIFASVFGSPRRRHPGSRQRQPQAQPRARESRSIDADVIDVDASEVSDRPNS